MNSFKELILGILRKLYYFIDLKELFLINKLRRSGKIIDFKEMIPYFENSKVFAFGTGGSVRNIKGIDKLKSKNILILTTGVVQILKTYGIQANIWLVHSANAVKMTMDVLDDETLKQIDFSKIFILVPDNLSKSKNIHFSSPTFRKLRKRIGYEATYVLYKENWHAYLPTELPNSYLKKAKEPIVELKGSTLEVLILPFLAFLGVKEIYFSGIDHMDTGHFWDRKNKYHDISGEILDFSKIRSRKLINKCSETALKFSKKRKIAVYRIEKNNTILKKYPIIEFETALSKASKRIEPNNI